MSNVVIVSFAHSSSQAGYFDGYTFNSHYYVGGEHIGWSLDESNHTNATHIKFRFSSSLNSYYRGIVTTGAGIWSNVVSIGEDASGIGFVKGNNNMGSFTPARFVNYSSNSSGHLTSWTIEVNTATNATVTSYDVAHEFGHVIGLNDLYNDMTLLMFGGLGGTATTATAKDRAGAKVILGSHSSHTWSYQYKSLGQHYHVCSVCGGKKTQNCTYNSNGYCTKCGAPDWASSIEPYYHLASIMPPEPVTAILPKAERRRSEA